MKVIDLLNKIANGEDLKEKHIKYFDRIDQEYDICMVCGENIIYKLDETSIKLNDEIEIIEEDKKDNFSGWKMYQNGKEVCVIDCTPKEDKKIEKFYFSLYQYDKLGGTEIVGNLESKINEIIDKINEMSDKE